MSIDRPSAILGRVTSDERTTIRDPAVMRAMAHPARLALLEHLSVGQLVLTGLSTESCVWMTACDAYIRGFGLIVPLDAVAGVSRAGVAATITGLRRVLGVRTPARSSSLRFARGRVL